MDKTQDKILGSWFGMAVGEAMGLAVRGLKPETIAQYFRQVDGYKDVRPFLGKGIKHYKMPGLYGAQTQRALVVCEHLLGDKKYALPALAERFMQLAQGGPDAPAYFGAYRHADGLFRKTLETFPDRLTPLQADQSAAHCGYVTLAVPIALYHQKKSPVMLKQCVETCLLLSRSFWEIAGAALTGYLATVFAEMEIDGDGPGEADAAAVLNAAIKFCEEAEHFCQERYPGLWDPAVAGNALSGALRALPNNGTDLDAQKTAICKNASVHAKIEVCHATQGYVLTLLPLALILVLRPGGDFASVLTPAINMGREADKLGALIGAWAGALYGFSRIPDPWKTGLVNAREIKLRGEALCLRRPHAALKDLAQMEAGLTRKEFEEQRKYAVRAPAKPPRGAAGPADGIPGDADDDEAFPMPRKDDTLTWRKFHKDKARMKRDRRRNLIDGGEL